VYQGVTAIINTTCLLIGQRSAVLSSTAFPDFLVFALLFHRFRATACAARVTSTIRLWNKFLFTYSSISGLASPVTRVWKSISPFPDMEGNYGRHGTTTTNTAGRNGTTIWFVIAAGEKHFSYYFRLEGYSHRIIYSIVASKVHWSATMNRWLAPFVLNLEALSSISVDLMDRLEEHAPSWLPNIVSFELETWAKNALESFFVSFSWLYFTCHGMGWGVNPFILESTNKTRLIFE
jgi:hypothetical protein